MRFIKLLFDNKKNMTSDKKQTLKIRQFQWYEVQTRVREIMVQLLQPFNKKQTQQSIKINEIKRNIGTITKKMEDHDFLLQRQNSLKPTYIDLQDKKIEEILNLTNNSQLENEAKLKKMEAVIDIYEEKIKQLNDLERRLDKQIIQRAEDFKMHKQNFDNQLELMVKKQDSSTEDINQFKNVTKSAVGKMETRMISFDNRLRELEDENKHKNSDIKKLLEQVSLNNQKIVKLELKTINLNMRIEDREKDSKLSEKFFTKVKEMENDFQFVTSFLEQYQPLYIQMQISETLNSYIEGRQRQKLCLYEEQKFARLHHHILMNERLTLEDMMSAYTNNIRKIINRNKKYIINLTVQQSIKYGNNVYEIRVADILYQEESNNNKNTNVIIPEEEIAKIVNEKLTTMTNDIKKLMEVEIRPTKTWMKQLQEQLLLRSLQYDSKYEEIKKKILDNQAKFQLEEKHVNQELANLKSKAEQLELTVNFQKDYIKDILNFSSVINHIVIQDEIDRQGTALYALKSAKNTEPTQMPVLQLDPNCVNCQNKNSTAIQQAFKMACLTYNPSQIRIDEQLFSRQQILQISTSILQKLKRKLWTTDNQKINTLVTLNPADREAIGKRVNVGSENRTARKSISTTKQAHISSRDGSRGREFQTLLPILASTKADKRQRKTQFSVFY